MQKKSDARHGERNVLWRLALASISVLAAILNAQSAQQVELMWIPSSDESVTGYFVYCTDATTHGSSRFDAGNTNACLVVNLLEGRTYQFYVTAYNESGLESEPSNAIEFSVPLPPIAPTITAGAGGKPVMRLHAPGSEGIRIALESSTDFKVWTTIVPAAGIGQSIDFTVAISETVEKRFFRSVTVPQ